MIVNFEPVWFGHHRAYRPNVQEMMKPISTAKPRSLLFHIAEPIVCTWQNALAAGCSKI